MKKLFFLFSFLSIALLVGAQESYTMYETMYIKPKASQEKAFGDALAAHNTKFHSSGANSVMIQWVAVGASAGEYVWVMGPTTFTDLDSRPSNEGHDDDWNKVMQYVDEISDVEYWKRDESLSYTPEGWEGTPKLHIRLWDVKTGHEEELNGFLKKVAENFSKHSYPRSWHIYRNQFNTGNGRDVAAVSGFTNWADFDEESNWVKDFEELHGEGSWTKAVELMEKITKMTEEVREGRPELGGLAE